MIITRFNSNPVTQGGKGHIQAGKFYYHADSDKPNVILEKIHEGSFDFKLNPICTVFLDDSLWFGKYSVYTDSRRLTLREILAEDWKYVQWLVDTNTVKLSAEVLKALKIARDAER